jgi:hypothetical protein
MFIYRERWKHVRVIGGLESTVLGIVNRRPHHVADTNESDVIEP